MNTKFIGFDRLKQRVTIEQVLARYGLLEQLRRSGDTVSGACPLHGGKNPTTFRVNLARNCWICFGKCHSGGSIVDFVSRMERVGIREAGLLLQEWFQLEPATIPFTPAETRPVTPQPAEHNAVLGFSLSGLDQQHRYLQQRGLNDATLQTFGLGLCSHGTLNGWIAIPIHNAAGQLWRMRDGGRANPSQVNRSIGCRVGFGNPSNCSTNIGRPKHHRLNRWSWSKGSSVACACGRLVIIASWP
jgi:hypothetical protein